MKSTMSTTLAATLIASVAGFCAWFFGISRAMWPAHPQLCAFLITVFTGIVVTCLWPTITGWTKS